MSKFTVKRTPNKAKPEFINPDGNAFVIGNGTSRKDFDLKPLMDHGLLVGCNYFYRDMHPHVLVLSDEAITNTVAKVDKVWMRRNWVYSWYPKMGGKIKKVAFPEKTSAGLMAVYESIVSHGAKKVFLVGMDFFGLGSKGKMNNGMLNNMYAGEKHYLAEGNVAPTYRNWQRRFQYVLNEFPDIQFYHVAPLDGKSPERLIGAPNWHQVSWDNLQDHLNNGAELVRLYEPNEEDTALFEEENSDNLRASIERQFSGQENFIYPDRIHPDTFIQIRLDIQAQYRKMGAAAAGKMLQIRIKDFDIAVPPTLIRTPQGMVLADDKFIVAEYQKEIEKRYKDMDIQLQPFRRIQSASAIADMKEKQSMLPQEEFAPPPPPPPKQEFIPPPPPPPPM